MVIISFLFAENLIDWVKVLRPTRHKIGHSEKQTCIHNTIYYNIKWTHKKTTARFGRLLRPPAWKRNGYILEGVDR